MLDLLLQHSQSELLTRVSAGSSLVVALSCLAGAGLVSYVVRSFRGQAPIAVCLPFGTLLAVTGLAHALEGLDIVHPSHTVYLAFRVLRALCALGAVVLFWIAVARVEKLLSVQRDAQRRELDQTAVLAELSAAYSRLQDQAELKTQVFANVSHELRTPLTLILGPIRELREAKGIGEDQRASLFMVERNAQLLLGHVNDLLELSRADAVGVALNQRATEVSQLLRTLAESFRPLASDLGIEYRVDLAPRLPPLLLDPEKLERVAMNLLANAFKFTPRSGKVALSLRVVDASESHDGQHELVLTVDDSGPGIRVEDRELVFERFRQLDGKPNRAFSGTGLGLSIVREFVAASSGSVRVEDSSLGGARLVVRLPADTSESTLDRESDNFPPSVSSAEMQALRQRPLPSPDAAGLAELPLVLVVEDNPDMNRFLCASLSSEFRITSAYDGRQALARLENVTPDLIVTDLMMPHMSGEEFVQALRGRQALLDIPVLVLTARDDVELRVRVLSAGIQDWLTKPFTVKELVARARNLVSARRARAILRTELTSREFDVGELASQLAARKRQLESLLESLSQALGQAELASRFKTSLLRLVSHELHTPLGAMQLQLERLSGEHRGRLNESQQQLILRIRRSLARLTDTIQSLLEHARIESGRLDLQVETFDLRELARGVVDDFSGHAESKGLKLELVAPDGGMEFESDCRLLRLVLVNLVANALKFTQVGGVVVNLALRAGRCEMSVQDTGPGIAQAQQTSVFEPFFQGEPATHQQYSQGAGLGLSLVREMLNALGGRIELSSEVGSGSTFAISIPPASALDSGTLQFEPARNIA